MKRKLRLTGLLAAMMLSAFIFVNGQAVAAPQVITDTSGVADSSDYIARDAVGEEGMVPLYAEDLKEGSYPIEVDSSSSMFPVPACTLTVTEGKLTAEMVMGGHGYLYLFMGTAEEAAAASQEEIASPGENENGKMTFTVEIKALNTELPCCAFSKNKEKWYERTVVFLSDRLPEDAILISAEELEARKAEIEQEKREKASEEEKKTPAAEPSVEETTEAQATQADSASEQHPASSAQQSLEQAKPLEESSPAPSPSQDNGLWRIPLILAIILGIAFLFWRHRKR